MEKIEVEHDQLMDEKDLVPATRNEKKFNWLNAGFLTLLPVVAFVSVGFYIYQEGIQWIDVILFLVFYMLTGLSITGGYHRYYAHRAFECNKLSQFFFLFFGAGAFQNSVLCWASDHRIHHRYVDKEKDPYNINKGFFWAHMGWIFFDEWGGRSFSNANDLKKDKLVMWQHKYYLPIAVFAGFGVPMLIGLAFDRPWGGLIWGGLVRQFFTHHSTFLINSAAHWFGKRPYSEANTARDSWWLAVLSFGEGYHNFHHAFPSDYRNGVRWYQWDPTKWMIGSMSVFKMSWGLRRTSEQTLEQAKSKLKSK